MKSSADTTLNQYISIPEYAKKLGISRIAVYKKVKKGQLPAKKIGRHYAILLSTDQQGISTPQPAKKILEEKQVSTAQLAKKLGISRFTVLQRIKSGKINARKCGRNYIVSSEKPKTTSQKAPKTLITCVNQLQSISQTSQQTSISRARVYQKIKAGKIEAEKIGRNFILPSQNIFTDTSQNIKQEKLTDRYISIPELANKLNISRIAVYKKVKKGQIKGFKVGRNYVVEKKEYLTMKNKQKNKGKKRT